MHVVTYKVVLGHHMHVVTSQQATTRTYHLGKPACDYLVDKENVVIFVN